MLQLFSIKQINNNISNLIICSSVYKNILRKKIFIYSRWFNFKPQKTNQEEIYTACFYARFHPQKGPDEMIDIWSIYLKKFNPNAKLLMVGDGPLFQKCKDIINKNKLSKNIILTGYISDENDKEKFFSSCKILIHPAIYDTGGMAALEVMSYGLPGISYDLQGLKETYPKGMIKVPCYNKNIFANEIHLVNNINNIYNDTLSEVFELTKEWDWKKRVKEIEKFASEY